MDVQLILSTGTGGAKHGFVAGWLGTLPNFIDNSWYIDSKTGHSNGYMSVTKDIESGANPVQLLKNMSLNLSPSADLFLAGQVHTHALETWHNIIDYDCVTITRITVPDSIISHIKWDFLVKTYLRKDRHKASHDTGHHWNIDTSIDKEHITNTDRIEKFKQLIQLNSMWMHDYQSPNLKNLKFIDLEYEKLFRLGGSRYLCEHLGINADQIHHRYWDQMLPLSAAPESINVWGVTWNKKDFFK